MKKIKGFFGNLKKVNLTAPLIGVIIGLALVIGYLLNYYGVINVAGLQQQNKTETKTEEPAKTTTEEPKVETAAPTPVPTPAPATPAPATINLSGSAYATGVKLSWSATNLDTSKGFKVIKSTSTNPVYPGSSAVYVTGSTKSYAWEIKDGKTYYFRVCQYTGAACGTYSNNVKVTAPYVTNTETPKDGTVSSMTISLVGKNSSNAKFSWIVNGVSAKGYKLVWSKNASPTYPTRDGDSYSYISDPGLKEGYVSGSSGETYHVRVCEYLGGACGVYSNQITVTLP